jgi:hypothetical protein
MIDGIVLGVFTWISFVLSFMHFPTLVKRFLLKNFFLTDISSVVISFILLTNISKSITSVIASMLCGLLVNLTLILHREFIA